ncbi:hypothetical protein U27_03975 [Candidatus Vecturithrix granuli]|uniref:Uncharacterized protein n=1 Tax=Vecturithrix granuli TaxID=1499967 RepID=A0A081BXF6_VECG1|nr:hypothetical protein U27_03975 [Candidatus Vecturithrix granuli]
MCIDELKKRMKIKSSIKKSPDSKIDDTLQWAKAEKLFIDQNPAKFEKKERRMFRAELQGGEI